MSRSTAPRAPECVACSLDGVRRAATDCREVEGLVMHLCHDHAIELDADRMSESTHTESKIS